MTSNTSTKNGTEEETKPDFEFEFDLEELKAALGIPELLAENEALRSLQGELLTYINYVDRTLQELQGEPVVTEDLQYNVSRGGRLEFQRKRPPAPSNLTRTKLALVSKPEEA